MNRRGQQGFTLAEFVVAIVFVGVVLGPLLVFVARIHDLNSAVGQQARREAWRTFNDQAVTAGIDPSQTPALTSAINMAVPAMVSQAVAVGNATMVAGRPTITPLRVMLDHAVAETRIAGSGFQIGAGAAVAPRGAPTFPLAPVLMPIPVITPADGTVLTPSSLTPAAPGNPYTLGIQASSSLATTVRVALNRPFGAFEGAGLTQFTVTAVDLATGVNGVAWTEYAGAVAAGDRAVLLGDGRTRWLVTTSEGRLQIYEPSAQVHFAYQLGLDAPTLVLGSVESPNGASLLFDFAGYHAVQSGETAVHIDFPAATKAVFGDAWAAQSIGFEWTFNDHAGPFSGNVAPFFAPDALSLWGDTVTVSARPIVPAATIADSGTWTLVRSKSVLGVPVISSAADSAGFHSPGELEFTAPAGPDGTPVGRLSFENGSSLSTGTTLSIPVIP